MLLSDRRGSNPGGIRDMLDRVTSRRLTSGGDDGIDCKLIQPARDGFTARKHGHILALALFAIYCNRGGIEDEEFDWAATETCGRLGRFVYGLHDCSVDLDRGDCTAGILASFFLMHCHRSGRKISGDLMRGCESPFEVLPNWTVRPIHPR